MLEWEDLEWRETKTRKKGGRERKKGKKPWEIEKTCRNGK